MTAAAGLLAAALAGLWLQPSGSARPPVPAGPRVVAVSGPARERSADLAALIADVRRGSDALVVLSGGASKMSEAHQRQLLAMFDALATLAKERRLAVGDGGTKAGIMEAAGRARLASGGAFPLIGVAPAREIAPAGQTPIDPHHSHVVAVDDPAVPKGEAAWGSETATMYWLFDRIADGRRSVAVVANGGGITLKEVEANVATRRPIILIAGSGRAADGIVSLLRGTTPADEEQRTLRARAQAAGLTKDRALFRIVPLEAGASGLLDALRAALGPAR